MRTIEYKVSFENMISRIPGLFAYLEDDEFGNVYLHKATDSIDGCYGKIIENIKIPANCRCDNPFFQKCYLTYLFADINNPLDIITQYQYNSLTDEQKESYIITETPKSITKEEYDNLGNDAEKNFYFVMYVDTRTNKDYITTDEYVNLSIKEGETYTYRTLMDYYYQFKDLLSDDNGFKVFIENGIGRIKVSDMSIFDEDEQEDKDKFGKLKDYELVPEFIYLANARKLYNEMVKMGKKCKFYEKMGKYDKYLCCLCEKYEKMGGDLFVEYLGKLIPKADTIARVYESYSDEENSMNLEFSVDLITSYNDMGIVSPYAPQWIPYKKYEKGDKVVYDDDIWICKEEFDENDNFITFNEEKWEKCNGYFTKMQKDETETDNADNDNSSTDPDNFKKIRLVSDDVWYDGCAVKHVAKGTDIGKEVLNYNVIETNEQITDICLSLKKGETDSKLKDLRRLETYVDIDNVSSRPDSGYDWLFYYRKGDILNIKTSNDWLGNILKLGETEPATSSSDKLEAYGDYMEDITVDRDECTITFTYHLGVHLKPKDGPEVVTDDDGNKLYKWSELVYDDTDKSGIKYKETYNYDKDSDLDKLANNNFIVDGVNETTFNFKDYIEGKYDISLSNYKFEFITYNNRNSYNKTIANQEVNIISTLTDFEVYRKDYSEFTETELFREEYLCGITYSPSKDIDVAIERGSTSVFDRLIAFSEVKTLEDMENFKNGSFFGFNKQ